MSCSPAHGSSVSGGTGKLCQTPGRSSSARVARAVSTCERRKEGIGCRGVRGGRGLKGRRVRTVTTDKNVTKDEAWAVGVSIVVQVALH